MYNKYFKCHDRPVQILHVVSGEGCSSHVGMVRPGQRLTLGKTCFRKEYKIIMHEFIHAIGFAHEQSRPDRDSYVKINWENIRDGRGNNNFWKKTSDWLTFGTEYDGKSIMHYPSHHQSINNKTTIVSIVSNKLAISISDKVKFTKNLANFISSYNSEKVENLAR